MKKISAKFLQGLNLKLKKHREKFNEVLNNKPHIRLRTFSFPKIFSHFLTSNIRIAHLTDQHVGRVTSMATQKHAIKLALDQNPDVVFLTGDFVCHSELYLEDLIEVIKAIDKPKFAVLGNHDHWTNAKSVKEALKKAQAEVLENAHTTIRIKNDYLQIIGLDDAYTKNDDLTKATKKMKKNLASIGLSHIPEGCEGLWQKGIPFVLSGHTHGGQITVAGLHELILKKVIGHKYIHGIYEEDEGHRMLYVSAGIGSAVMPIRLGENGKREVAIFDLLHLEK